VAIRSSSAVLSKSRQPAPLDDPFPEQSRYGFGTAVSEEEPQQHYEGCHAARFQRATVPGGGREPQSVIGTKIEFKIRIAGRC
jgi:hypothetical protein